MLRRPADLTDGDAAAVAAHWHIDAAALDCLPVGFGSHHCALVDSEGSRWFVTIDDLDHLLRDQDDDVEAAGDRLDQALGTALALQAAGLQEVVAPMAFDQRLVTARIRPRFAIAVYPFVDAETFEWGPFKRAGDRLAVVEVIARLHDRSTDVRSSAPRHDLAIPKRDQLAHAVAEVGSPWGGPYGERLRGLLLRHGGHLLRRKPNWLRRFDAAAARAGQLTDRRVVTHGEAHAGNTIKTPAGWRLIDWDTVALAQPERDLWMLHAEDAGTIPPLPAGHRGGGPWRAPA